LFVLAIGPNPKQIPSQAFDALCTHARLLSGKPRLAYRRYGADWVFFYLDDIREESDHYRIPDWAIEGYGISIDDL
jgi:Holliday junction resolvase